MLRLVPPPRAEGQDPPARRRGQAPALSLTDEETRALRVSARNIARSYGGMAGLARALGVNVCCLGHRKTRPHPGLAIALSRLTKIPVEQLLTPRIAAVPSPPTAPTPEPVVSAVAGGA